ncbi:MAG: hypothetical protein IKI94_07525 [Ruminococcus sp.]|nr:hypothetical protein [Ruminococcus sp.]
MKTNDKILKEMARLGALQTENAKYTKADDIIIEDYEGTKKRLIIDDITDDDLHLLVSLEQLRTLKSIKWFIKTTFILGLIVASIWILSFLISLGNTI